MSRGDLPCHVERIQAAPGPAPDRTEVVVLGIGGMGCPNCANRVHNALVRLPGVVRARVELRGGGAKVEYDPDRVDAFAMLAAIDAAGRSSGHRYVAAPLARPSASSPRRPDG